MRALVLGMLVAGCARTPSEQTAPSMSASSAPAPAAGWRWPGPMESRVYHRDPNHLYNRIHRLVRGGEDRVLLAHSGWSWLSSHWSAAHIRDFDQAAPAGDPWSTTLFRLQPTADNRFRYLDDGLSLAVSHLDAARARELGELLTELAKGKHERNVKGDLMLQRDLWQLADSIQGGWVHVAEPAPLVTKLVSGMMALARTENVADLAWAKAPHDLPQRVRDEAAHGWIEWATEGHVHHSDSKRSMPFEERVYGIWRTFVRFPDNDEGKAAAAALSQSLEGQSLEGKREALLAAVVGKDGSLPAGSTLAGTVHLVHLTKTLEPVATSCLLQVLVRKVAPKTVPSRDLAVHEVSRRALAVGGGAPLVTVPLDAPSIYVLNAGPGHSGLMLASRGQTCLVCHQVKLHGSDTDVFNEPLSWVYDDRTPGPGSAGRAIDISMKVIERAVARLPKD